MGSLFGGALRAVAAKPSANRKAGTTPLPPRVKGNGAGHGTAISVVVPTFNRGIRLARLLQHLAEQTLPHTDFEVIVVDDGSSPPAAVELDRERAAGRPFPLRFRLEVQPNSGAAAARHRGALLAVGDLLLFVDDDMQVPPGFPRCASPHPRDQRHFHGGAGRDSLRPRSRAHAALRTLPRQDARAFHARRPRGDTDPARH